MSLSKHPIPLLEYDSDPSAVIRPDHEGLDVQLPKKAVFAFLGDCIDRYAAEHHASIATYFVSATKQYPIYVLSQEGEDIVLAQAPVGASAATQILDFLIGYGVEEIISAGSCGVLEEIPENTFLLPVRALRDEGTSYHYLPPSRFAEFNPLAGDAIRKTLEAHGIGCREITTWSTDGFYRETAEKVAYRKSEGCSAVEMESSALAACAQFRSATFGMLLYTADSLADTAMHDARGWGEGAREYALTLCLEAVLRIDTSVKKAFSTSRLTVGTIRERDRREVVSILRSDTVKQTYMIPDYDCDEAAYPLFDRLLALSWKQDRYVFGVRLEDRLIGFFNDVDIQGDTVEMGYAFHPDFYGQGYATEAFGAVIERLFSLGFRKITAGAFLENPASIRVMEKCGMTRLEPEETVEYRGMVHRCACYAIEKK